MGHRVMPSRIPMHLIVPAVAVTLAGGTLATAAAPRTLLAARVWGGPTDVPGPQSVRIECVRRSLGIEDHVPAAGLRVSIGGTTSDATCDDAGAAEVKADLDGRGPVAVRVVQGNVVLVDGTANVTRARWLAGMRELGARLQASGQLPIRAFVDAGVLPIERWTAVRLEMPEELAKPEAVRITANGAEIGAPRIAAGGLKVLVRPTFPTATLTIERASDPPGSPGWEARLPVVSSALSVEDVEVASGEVRAKVRSSPARERAYVRIEDQRGRIAATSIPLERDGRGGSWGTLSLPIPPPSPPAWLVVAADPDASGSSAMSWPIVPPGGGDGRIVADVKWADGVAPIAAHESTRVRRVTIAVGALVAAAAILEAVLLVFRGRDAHRTLRAHLAEFAGEADVEHVEEAAWGARIVLGVAAVLFGFAIVGVVLVLRM